MIVDPDRIVFTPLLQQNIPGTMTCGFRPGSEDYEAIDAQTYADMGVDFLKQDSCFATVDHVEAVAQYAKMRDALQATGRKIFFSLCGWNRWYAPVGEATGHAWRISADVDDWVHVYRAVRTNEGLEGFAGPGRGWNDPDMLLGSGTSVAVRVEPHQSRAQFSLWCVMAAPLLIGADLNTLTEWDLATYSNKQMVQMVNQDPLGLQGKQHGQEPHVFSIASFSTLECRFSLFFFTETDIFVCIPNCR